MRPLVDKLARIKQLLTTWLHKKATKQQILLLVGTLHHATKVVHPGRAFVTAMYSIASRLPKMHFITRLNILFHLDLLWLHAFLWALNGFSILRHPTISHPEFRQKSTLLEHRVVWRY